MKTKRIVSDAKDGLTRICGILMSKDDKKPWYEDIKDRFHKLEKDVAYMRGELDEMKRHNSKLVKILVAIVGVMGAIIVALIQVGNI